MDKTTRYILIAAGSLLLLGCFPLPYGYYSILRGMVSIAAVLLFISALKLRQYGWMAVSLPSFLLWFPLFGFQLQKSEWVYLDLVFGIFYLAAGFGLQNTRGKSSGKSDSKSE
jgi:MFS superfamily sulfate permease-like transporter